MTLKGVKSKVFAMENHYPDSSSYDAPIRPQNSLNAKFPVFFIKNPIIIVSEKFQNKACCEFSDI